jgi:hypothetical protein
MVVGGNGDMFSAQGANSSALSFFGPNGSMNRPVANPEGEQFVLDENGMITKGFIPSGPTDLSTEKQKVSDRPRE